MCKLRGGFCGWVKTRMAGKMQIENRTHHDLENVEEKVGKLCSLFLNLLGPFTL
jgi:hypothetical protein